MYINKSILVVLFSVITILGQNLMWCLFNTNSCFKILLQIEIEHLHEVRILDRILGKKQGHCLSWEWDCTLFFQVTNLNQIRSFRKVFSYYILHTEILTVLNTEVFALYKLKLRTNSASSVHNRLRLIGNDFYHLKRISFLKCFYKA